MLLSIQCCHLFHDAVILCQLCAFGVETRELFASGLVVCINWSKMVVAPGVIGMCYELEFGFGNISTFEV